MALKSSLLTRRSFLAKTGLATAGTMLAPALWPRRLAANDKLNVAVIGVANQGAYNLGNVASENIVALCDVDEKLLGAAAEKFPEAKKYTDFRKLIDQKGIDAIVIATPDHTHAVATVAALKTGRHVYCEKPLTHTVSECRIVRELAAREKKVTQMGTQIHAGANYRRVVELIQSKAIGEVNEVHVWAAASYGNKQRPTDTPPVPAGLNYDLWLGPVLERPYHPEYVPFHWRNWWHFGGGTLADLGCHFMDLPHWALGLKDPTHIEAEGPEIHRDSPPAWMIVRYRYARPGIEKPLKLTWYHGGRQPEALPKDLAAKYKSGVLFMGDQGALLSDYGRHQFVPERADFKKPAQTIPDSIGHHQEWLQAIRTGGVTTCNFDYSGALTEAVLLGNVAFRTGKKLEWDAAKMKATNCPEADQFIQHHYRAGWSI